MLKHNLRLRLLSIFHYVLGVFTIIVLSRPSVRSLFEAERSRAP